MFDFEVGTTVYVDGATFEIAEIGGVRFDLGCSLTHVEVQDTEGKKWFLTSNVKSGTVSCYAWGSTEARRVISTSEDSLAVV